MSTKIVPLFFDLETINLIEDGDNDYTKLRYSVAVTRTRKTNFVFYEKDIKQLIEQLDAAELIVGHNHIGFDFQVLKGYEISDSRLKVWREKSFDTLLEIQSIVGQRVSLDHLSKNNLKGSPGKLAPGDQCPTWYKEGKLDKIEELCTDDVQRLAKVFGLIVSKRPLTIVKYWGRGADKFAKFEITVPIPPIWEGAVWG